MNESGLFPTVYLNLKWELLNASLQSFYRGGDKLVKEGKS